MRTLATSCRCFSYIYRLGVAGKDQRLSQAGTATGILRHWVKV